MRARTLTRLALAAVLAAIIAPAATAATPQYDGYKSGYPRLHQILTYHAATAHHTATQASVLPRRGFAWRDAGIGLLAGLLAAGLITVSLTQLRRNRTSALP